jgi:hypothetical protein
VDIELSADLAEVLVRYQDEIRRCRYGSFRGVIKDGKVVIFAIEHEWRPQLDARRDPAVPDAASSP